MDGETSGSGVLEVSSPGHVSVESHPLNTAPAIITTIAFMNFI
jgi:hypothetical protein